MDEQEKETVVSEAESEKTKAEDEKVGEEKTKATASDEEVSIEELQRQTAELTEEKDKVYNRMLRLQAEYENYKKRSEREKIAERKYKSQDLANELLPVLDNFERALQVEVTEANKGIIDGITMVYQQFLDALKSQGIEQIEALNKEFDPNLHHAVMQTENSEVESNIVVEELQKGFMLKDRVIRPAMVKVNK